jgi:hypothetical protein
VLRRKNWSKKGKRKKVKGNRRKGRVNVMGALRLSDKKTRVEFLEKGTGENFFKVLEGFYEDIKIEWSEQGNKIEKFEINGPKILIILDNASIHKKKEFLEKIKEKMPNLIIEFLPEYSPDYNLR